jgi:hypothetical protein
MDLFWREGEKTGAEERWKKTDDKTLSPVQARLPSARTWLKS